MLAILITLLFPVMPILLRKLRYKVKTDKTKRKVGNRSEEILRYGICFLFMTFMSSFLLPVFSDDGNSFWRKINDSTEFAAKFLVLEAGLAVFYAGLEWFCEQYLCRRKEELEALWREYDSRRIVRIFRKYVGPGLLYVLAIGVVCLNVSMMFDNVLWGDEAFSANTAQKSLGGILQVLYYWDNHPPLYYYWLKLFGALFGYTVPVFHAASLVPFGVGIVLAVTLFRKRFGALPATFFVILSGLGAACLEYNLEVRMYALAFLCVAACFYCSCRVLATGSRSAWIGMVLWALAGAYSHYYALVTVGILLFCTGVAVWLKHRGRTWEKGAAAIAAFLIGYAPWLFFFYAGLKTVSNGWWMTEILGLDISMQMIMGGAGMSRLVLPLLLLLLVTLLLTESSLFVTDYRDGTATVRMQKPSVKNWSDKTYAMVVGAMTIVGTLAFAYLLCVIMAPMLAERYLYPLSAVAIMMLVVGSSRVLEFLQELGVCSGWNGLAAIGRAVLILFMISLFTIGVGNYQCVSTQVAEQKGKTDATLALIGEPDADVKLVTNGVKHLGWTVLYFYYPDNEVVNGDYHAAQANRFWYFSPEALSEDARKELQGSAYQVTDHGVQQISQYPFYLYYIFR